MNISNTFPNARHNSLPIISAIILLSVMVVLSGISRDTYFAGILYPIIFLIISSMFIVVLIKDSYLKIILILSLLTKIGLTFINYYIFALPDSSADAVYFEMTGWDFANFLNGDSNTQPTPLPGTYLITASIGVIYSFLGRIPILPQIGLVFSSTLLIYVIYKITLELSNNRKSALIASVVALVFPTFNLYSAILLRESLVSIAAAFSVYFFILFWKYSGFHRIVFSLLSLAIASSLHSGVLFIGVSYFLLYGFYNKKNSRFHFFQIHKLSISLLLGFAVFIFFGDAITSKLPSLNGNSVDIIGTRLGDYAVSRAAYLTGITPTNFIDFIIQTPVRIIYFLFTPFPWMVSSVGDLIGFIDAFFYIVLIYYARKGLIVLKKKNKAFYWIVFLSLSISLVVFSWGTSNYGTAIRHRQKIAFLFIVIASIGFTYRKIKKRDIFHILNSKPM